MNSPVLAIYVSVVSHNIWYCVWTNTHSTNFVSASGRSLLPGMACRLWGYEEASQLRPSSEGGAAESDPGILLGHRRGRQFACGLVRERGEGGPHPSLRAAGSKTAVRGVAVRGVAVMVGVADECQGGRPVTACLVEVGRMAAWLAGEPWLGREKR